jgi:cytoskeleton protein RodZ
MTTSQQDNLTPTPSAEPVPSVQAGALLRQYREAAGLNLEDLSKQLRVSKTKLMALEQDNWTELTDVVFVRSLALSVCRYLKVDATAVLEALPRHTPSSLKTYDANGLNSPVERPKFYGASGSLGLPQFLRSKSLAWGAGGVLAAAVAYGVFSWLSEGASSEVQTLPTTQSMKTEVIVSPNASENATPQAGATATVSNAATPTPAASIPATSIPVTSIPATSSGIAPSAAATTAQTPQGKMVITTVQPGVPLPQPIAAPVENASQSQPATTQTDRGH